MSDKGDITLLVVIVLILSVMSFCVGFSGGERYIRERAIEAGVGRWTVDPRTGATGFEFVTVKQEREHE